jgi:hypothetical protein
MGEENGSDRRMFRMRSEDFYERSFRLMLTRLVRSHLSADAVVVRKGTPLAACDLFYGQYRSLENACGAGCRAAGSNMRFEAFDVLR